MRGAAKWQITLGGALERYQIYPGAGLPIIISGVIFKSEILRNARAILSIRVSWITRSIRQPGYFHARSLLKSFIFVKVKKARSVYRSC